jgi:hypothetical protein
MKELSSFKVRACSQFIAKLLLADLRAARAKNKNDSLKLLFIFYSINSIYKRGRVSYNGLGVRRPML